MSRFVLQKTPIEDLLVIERQRLGDHRGFLERIFCIETLSEFLVNKSVRQINFTYTKKRGSVRGLHFQYPPHGETKIITCTKGEIWDVAVDLRKESKTFLKYHAVRLSENNPQSYFIPEGFAHGFQALTSDCQMIYLHTSDYKPESEGALNALDPRILINWPEDITERSERDENHAFLTEEFLGLEL